MSKRFFRSIAPQRKHIVSHKALNWLNDHLNDPAIWRFNRHNIARAVRLGILIGFVPLPFVQMILAAWGSLRFRTNLPVTVVSVWITNPITLAPLLLWSHFLGSFIMPGIQPGLDFESHQAFWASANDFWPPMLLGWILTAAFLSTLGYYVIKWVWVWSVLLKRRSLRLERAERSAAELHRSKRFNE
jgi:uncharacterized protein (DUF2062 family)